MDADELETMCLRVGRRRILARGRHFGHKPLVYHVFHGSTTLHTLYQWTDHHLWWKFLDSWRNYWPAWFLPSDFVVKLYANDEDRLLREARAYARLKPIQGRGVPRFYGRTYFAEQPGLLLEFIKGQPFTEFAKPYRETFEGKVTQLIARRKLQDDQMALFSQQQGPSASHYKGSPIAISSFQSAEEDIKALCNENWNIAQPLITKIQLLASRLSSLGVVGDFDASNVICYQDYISFIDFENTFVQDRSADAKVENEGGIDQLFTRYGFLWADHVLDNFY